MLDGRGRHRDVQPRFSAAMPNAEGRAFLAVGGLDPNFATSGLPRDSVFSTSRRRRRDLSSVQRQAFPRRCKLISGNSTVGAGRSESWRSAGRGVAKHMGGGVMAGSTINWTVSPAGRPRSAPRLRRPMRTANSNTVRLATNASGNVQVTASLAGSQNSALSSTFTLTAIPNITVTGLQIISGNNQSAIVNTAFGAPLVVQLNASERERQRNSGAVLDYRPGTLSSTSVNTNSSGQAQVNVQATGANRSGDGGRSASGFTQTFNLTVSPPGRR